MVGSREPLAPARAGVVALAAVVLLLAAGGNSSASARRGGDVLLPNLVPLVPGEIFGPQTGLVPSFGYGYPAPPMALQGCLLDEIVRKNVSKCLRFETIVRNVGRGPFELLFKAEAPAPGAYQILYDRAGGTRARFASASEYHPTHHHFHLRGFYEARLWRAAENGMPGPRPVARGEKSGFCPEDGSRDSGGNEGRYRCLADYRTDGIGAGQVVGISAGWSDAYRMHLPDQFIEVSGLQDGSYVLQITIDPDDQIRETNERDNSTCVLIELKGDDATANGEVAACPR